MNFPSQKIISFFTRVSPEKILSFTKQLFFLIGSGVPLYRAIQIIQSQTLDPRLKKVLKVFAADLTEGRSFTDCLSLYPESFSEFYLNMISVGESRGEMEESLRRIYEYMESSKELQEKIINALTYPAILVITGLAVLSTMVIFVLPKFANIFSSSNIPLPLPTRILLKSHTILIHHYPLLIIVILAIIVGYFFLRKYPDTRYYLDKNTLGFPVIGTLFLNIYVARFCRTLGTLYNSGVQLLPAIELSKASFNNLVLGKEIDEMLASVRDGKGIAHTLARSRVFPPMMSQMIAVGEETGALEKVLIDVANYYEQETNFAIRRIMVLIEPIALIIISLFVTLIASAVMLPLFRMTSVMRSF